MEAFITLWGVVCSKDEGYSHTRPYFEASQESLHVLPPRKFCLASSSLIAFKMYVLKDLSSVSALDHRTVPNKQKRNNQLGEIMRRAF